MPEAATGSETDGSRIATDRTRSMDASSTEPGIVETGRRVCFGPQVVSSPVPGTASMRRLLVLFLVATFAGCAASRTGNPFEGGSSRGPAASGPETFRVQAMNPSFMDVTIFAINAYSRGQRVRIGRLNSTQERTFTFNMTSATREVRFELEYFTGPTCVTGVVSLIPETTVELILPAEPRNERGCR